MTSSPFAGTWHLESWSVQKNGEPTGYPMGEDARGQILYADDGCMSAFLMRADFGQGSDGPTADTCIAYGGSWRVDDDRIIHQVAFATLPHWIGRPLVRYVARDGAVMTLRTEPEFSKSGNRYEHILVWRKT